MNVGGEDSRSELAAGQAPGLAPHPDVPTGTVTFLFTDIEGSTRLLEQLKEQYGTVLADQRDLLRAAFGAHNGHEIDTQGDAFFVAFSRALDAITCVVAAQRSLAAHAWPQGVSVRVRMGLHTGEPILDRTGYVGMDVHRAARIAGAGHGGQVLLSQATRELIHQDLPSGVSLRSLGDYKLKDIRFPQTLYQLDIAGLPVNFSPLKTLSGEDEPPTPGEAPYQGLQYFDEVDTGHFFGRAALTERLIERVCASRFLAVVGASGSGKSSLVRAGLVSALKQGGRLAPGAASHCPDVSWHVHLLTPTAHPLEALASSLTRHSESVTAAATLLDDMRRDARSLHLWVMRQLRLAQRGGQGPAAARVLVVVDQFEELFTLCRDEAERRPFVDNLLAAVEADGGGTSVVLTLRADFYEHLAAYPALSARVAQDQEYIGAMNSAELRQAIEAPAAQGGWELSAGLVDLLLHEVGVTDGRQPEPGALPLLSHALLETWKRRRGNLMNLKAYSESGGVRGAIARTAEGVYRQELTPAQQTIARSIFLRLTEPGEGTQDTRRLASYHELVPAGDPQQVEEVLARLADARLITTGENAVEFAHEALIREWPTLREWLNEDREGLRLHRHLTGAAQAWERLGRDPGELYRGARLAQASEWAAAHGGELNAVEREFLDASRARADHEEAEREAHRQRELQAAQQLAEANQRRADEQAQAALRLRTRNRIVVAAGLAALLLAVLAGLFGLQARQNAALAGINLAAAQSANTEAADFAATAQAERDRADAKAEESFSRELAVQSQLNLVLDPERSILLALAGLDRADTQEAENALHKAVATSRLRLVLRGHTAEVLHAAYSPDGKRIATASVDMTARIWDAAAGVQLALFQDTSIVNTVEFTPDGARLVTSNQDGRVTFWDVASGQPALTIQAVTPEKLDDTIQDIRDAALSPDGRLLATTATGDHQVRFWDTNSGAELFSISSPSWMGVEPGVDLGVSDVEFSPDGKQLALSLIPQQGGVELWDLATRKKLLSLADHWYSGSDSLSFSPDGMRILTGGNSTGRPTIWDATTGNLIYSLNDDANQIKFSSDGQRLLGAMTGGRVKVYGAETGQELLSLLGHTGVVFSIVEQPGCVRPPEAPFAWCGTHLATSSSDTTVRVWDVSPAGSEELLTLPGFDLTLNEAGTRITTFDLNAYNPDDGPLTIDSWDLLAGGSQDGQPVVAANHRVDTIEFGPGLQDYRAYLLSGILGARYDGGHYRFWDLTNKGQEVYHFDGCLDADFAFSTKRVPRVALACLHSGLVEIWDPTVPAIIKTLQGGEPETPKQVFLSPDGQHLALLTEDNSVELVDVATGLTRDNLPVISNVQSFVNFSPDSRWVAVSDCAGNVTVLDAATGDLRQSLRANLACIAGVTFSPDGTKVAATSFARGLAIWDLASGREIASLAGGRTVQFSPDGTRLFAGIYEPLGLEQFSVRMFTLRLDELVALARTHVTRALTNEECREYLHVDQCP